jgi:hypothetical protein
MCFLSSESLLESGNWSMHLGALRCECFFVFICNNGERLCSGIPKEHDNVEL